MSDAYEMSPGGTTLTDNTSGMKYHVSLFREALERIAREAYRLGKMTEDDAIRQAIEKGYSA